jgi:aspartate/methionine/tyrosine aminotransferase
MKFSQKHQIHLISDEIFGCSVLDSGEPDTVPFTSLLSIDTTDLIDPNLCHVIYAMSKDFGAAGLRLGAIITRNKSLKQAFDVQAQFHDPSGPSLVLATAMLQDREWCRRFLEISQDRLAAAFRHVTNGLKQMGVEYLPGSNAGFFLWVDLSPYLPNGGTRQEREFQLAQKLVDKNIFLHPGEEHSMDAGWFRLVYTTSPEVVTEGLKR